ncbi:hypothetical protein ACIRPH_10340 [Nocardiopsis sp. NPDC101807]|uniref:hypothetical protein n=1 Tax=Nocardiopsis sp. NPDC101807 TaxID=3364339 RepID=UPI00382C6D88
MAHPVEPRRVAPLGRWPWTLGERGAARSPPFDVMVALDRPDRAPAPSAGGVSFEARELPRRSKEADLLFAFVLSDGEPEPAPAYDGGILPAQRARGLLEGLCPILDAMADNRPVARILDREETSYE